MKMKKLIKGFLAFLYIYLCIFIVVFAIVGIAVTSSTRPHSFLSIAGIIAAVLALIFIFAAIITGFIALGMFLFGRK